MASDVLAPDADALPDDITAPDAEWWRGAVFYHIYPRSFQDSTGNGVGDLPGIIARLDHVASLGVDGIWISPFFTSPMKDYGYDVADYCDVDPIFGTLEDFDRLVTKAHDLGLRLIIDQVYSHTSDEHPWFAESRSSRTNAKADWYVWADAKPEGSPPSNWQSVFGGPAWEWDARRQQYYLHNFLKEQPQLNVHNRDVQDALLAAARFWLDRGVDGFRLDAINFAMHNRALTDNPPSETPMALVTRPFDMQHKVYNQSQPEITDFLERVRDVLDTYDAPFTVAEVGGPNPIDEMKAFTEGETRLNSAYSFDFLYAEDLTADRVKASLGQWSGAPGEGWPSWAFSNHDSPRAVSRWAAPGDEKAMSRLMLLLLLSLRGNAFIYQGEELGLPQAEVPFERLLDPEAIANWPRTLGRDGARTPMPWVRDNGQLGFSSEDTWLPVDPRHAPFSVAEQEADPAAPLHFARKIVALRKTLPALVRGDLTLLETSPNVLAFERRLGEARNICVYNLSNEDTAYQPGGSSTVLADTGRGVVNGDGSPPRILTPWSGYWARQ